MENLTDNELFNLMDGEGSEAEKISLRTRLNNSPDSQRRLKELQSVHRFLQNQKGLELPSKNFTDKVMSGLHSKNSFAILSPKNGLILLTGIIVASTLAILLASSGAFDNWHTLINFNQAPIKTDWVKMPTSVPLNTKLVVKIVVLLNTVLALILLDRTILRPIFQKRAERFGL